MCLQEMRASLDAGLPVLLLACVIHVRTCLLGTIYSYLARQETNNIASSMIGEE